MKYEVSYRYGSTSGKTILELHNPFEAEYELKRSRSLPRDVYVTDIRPV